MRAVILVALFLFAHSWPAAGADTFRIRLPADPLTIDWVKASTNFETYVVMNIMEGLVEIDKTLQPVPALADSWSMSKDGLTYVFHLRPGVKWSDGVPLTAKDFIFAWKRLLAPGSKNTYASFLFDINGAEDFHKGVIKDFSKVGVKALGNDRVEIRLRRVVPYFLSLLSFWVTFPQREDLVSKKGWDEPGKLVVLGPFTVSRWEKGKQIVLTRNPSYYGPAPALREVTAYIEPDAAKARKLFKDGKIDVLLDLTTEDLASHFSGSANMLRQFDYIASVFLAFNVAAKPVDNVELRRAIAQAIDRAGMPAALGGGETPSDSIVPKGIAGYEPIALPFSAERARLALKAAGYKSPADVPPLAIMLVKKRGEATAAYLQKSLRETLGIRVNLDLVSPEEYFVRLRKSKKFQLAIALWGADYPDASSFMDIFLSDNPFNYSNLRSSHYDRLVKAAGGSLNMLDRMKGYAEAQRLLLQGDAAVVPLYHLRPTALLGPRVSSFELHALNRRLFLKNIQMK